MDNKNLNEEIDRLRLIIERQKLALERCKEQRDEWVDELVSAKDDKLISVLTYERIVDAENKELQKILGGES